jgi:hypothetical protein
MLVGVSWYLVTDVSGQPVGVIFKGQAVLEKFFLDCMKMQELSDVHAFIHTFYLRMVVMIFTCVIPCILGYICCNLPTYAQYDVYIVSKYT